MNNSCSPFTGPNGSCTLGNLASYAINVSDAATVAAGIQFAQEKNLRLSIKNTGHDYIGRSNGEGSLGLWTHNLKNISFLNYRSLGYTGPAVKLGAGVQAFEIYEAAAQNGLRVTGGYCPSVGLTGGFFQSGGHGPLASAYGLAADNTLEFEVVTTNGQHMIASPTQNSDLYWALSGGGAGNFAVVLSLTTKAHVDGPTSGASFSFANTDEANYWNAVALWNKHLLYLDTIPGFSTNWAFDESIFVLEFATFPGGDEAAMNAALSPFFRELEKINVTLASNVTTEGATFYQHFETYVANNNFAFAPNETLGGRLISRSAVENSLPALIDIFREILTDNTFALKRINGASYNVTHARVGNTPASNSVLPAWRDSLYTLSAGVGFISNTSTAELQIAQAKVNSWQNLFKPVTPGGGAYMNEATWNDPDYKEDYFGENYEKLLQIKRKYDPNFALWQHTSVGSDAYWEVAADGRLCKI